MENQFAGASCCKPTKPGRSVWHCDFRASEPLLRELAACIETLRQQFRFGHYTADSRKGTLLPDSCPHPCHPTPRRSSARPWWPVGWAAMEVHVCLTVPAPLFSPPFSVSL